MHSCLYLPLLTWEECDAALQLLQACPSGVALVEGGISPRRQGRVAWLSRSPRSEWLYQRFDSVGREFAREAGIDVDRLNDPLQFAMYPRGSVFDWHLDAGSQETRFRKVTISAQLTSGNDYVGGNLEIVSEAPMLFQRGRGSGIVFASVLGHRVTRITRGSRCALVGWMHGPPWR